MQSVKTAALSGCVMNPTRSGTRFPLQSLQSLSDPAWLRKSKPSSSSQKTCQGKSRH
jgi:hypothetical protein